MGAETRRRREPDDAPGPAPVAAGAALDRGQLEEVAFRKLLFERQSAWLSRGDDRPSIRSPGATPPPRQRAPSSAAGPDIERIGETIEELPDLCFQDYRNIVFEDCTFKCDLNLTGAACRRLSLRNSKLRTVLANDIQVDGTVDLRGVEPQDAAAAGRVIMRGARIGGSVELYGASLRGDLRNAEYPWALDLAQADIGNAVTCLDKPHEEHADRPGLESGRHAQFNGGATLNRSVVRNTVWFRNLGVSQAGTAPGLNFEGAEIVGAVVIDDGAAFSWTGHPLIKLSSADVKRDIVLDFSYWPAMGKALRDFGWLIFARDALVGNSVLVNIQRSGAMGFQPVVDFPNCDIDGNLSIDGASGRSVLVKNGRVGSDLTLGDAWGSRSGRGLEVSRGRFQFVEEADNALHDSLHGGLTTLLNAKVGGSLRVRNISLTDNLSDIAAFEPREKCSTALACYPGWRLHHVSLRRPWQDAGRHAERNRGRKGDAAPRLVFSYLSKGRAAPKAQHVLSGRPAPFDALNKAGALRLNTPAHTLEYLMLFSHHIYGGKLWRSSSPFLIRVKASAYDPKELQDAFASLPADRRDPDFSDGQDLEHDFPTSCDLGKDPSLARFCVTRAGDDYRARGLVVYQGIYFLSLFSITRAGKVVMIDDAAVTFDGERPAVSKKFVPITADSFRPHVPGQELLFESACEATALSRPTRDFVVKRRDEELAVLESGDLNFVLSKAPYRIDLRGADAAILDDLDGEAWAYDFCEAPDACGVQKLGIDLENFTYDAIFQDVETIKTNVQEKTDASGENTESESDAAKNGDGLTGGEKDGYVKQLERDNAEEAVTKAIASRLTPAELADRRICWINRQLVGRRDGIEKFDYEHYCAQPYRQLISVLDRAGEAEISKNVAIRWIETKHRVEQNEAPGRLTRIIRGIGHDVLNWGFRYGYGWFRACLGMLALIMAGMVAAGALENRGLLIADLDSYQQRPGAAPADATSCKGVADFFVFSADLFIPLVDFQQRHRCRVAPVPPELRAAYRDGAAPAERVGLWVKDPRTYEVFKGVYVLIGWIWTALTGLTVTGLLRRAGLRE